MKGNKEGNLLQKLEEGDLRDDTNRETNSTDAHRYGDSTSVQYISPFFLFLADPYFQGVLQARGGDCDVGLVSFEYDDLEPLRVVAAEAYSEIQRIQITKIEKTPAWQNSVNSWDFHPRVSKRRFWS